MNLEKESKMLEQGILIWLLFAAAILIVWGAAFAATFYVLKDLLWAAVAATFVTAGFVLAARKLL